jgi:omega-6 fatty acid desaturase (delta-12 desaturase)
LVSEKRHPELTEFTLLLQFNIGIIPNLQVKLSEDRSEKLIVFGDIMTSVQTNTHKGIRNYKQQLNKMLVPYRVPQNGKAVWQLINTVIPYFLLWGIMVYLLKIGITFWYILPLIILAGGLLVRIFIIFHDCCHGSFLASRKAMKIIGYITGVLTFTPYYHWRRDHLMHHATSGNLDQRGVGDVWTMTTEEYRSASRSRKLAYRFYRNPFVLLILGPIYSFYIKQRFSPRTAGKKERRSVLYTNLGIAFIILLAGLTIGLKTYLILQFSIMIFAGAAGVWLFYVQHQYENVYWERQEKWDVVRASLEGSSYYKMPQILQWFTGNIGLHHIHHLEARIPNYRLQECQDKIANFIEVEPLTLRTSLKSLRLNLWDEKQKKMLGFRALKA